MADKTYKGKVRNCGAQVVTAPALLKGKTNTRAAKDKTCKGK